MRKVLIVVLSLALSSTACSTAWVSTLDSILAAAAPALINILQIVSVANSEPMNSTLAAKIDDDAVAIKTLAADFAKDGGSNACTILQNAVATYQVDQALVLQLAQVKDSNTQTKIALLADLVSGTIGAITAVIPACQPSTASPKSADVERLLKLEHFVASYNVILTARTGNAPVDAATPKLVIHQHSKVARYVSLGVLK
ncbi:MAG: hypothetical protein WCC78_16075 [Terriglobales bacterium]